MQRLGCALAFVFVAGCSCTTTQETADSGNGVAHDVGSGQDVGPGHDAFVPNTMDGGARSLPSRCKRGMAYGHDSHADLAALTPAVGWWYDWATQPDDALRDGSYAALGVDFTPMVWGGTFDPSAVITQIPTGAHALLGFNEPNFGAPQSNLTSMQAAMLWPQVEQIADARGLLLVSPAVNFCGGNCTDTDPFHWLETFLADCPSCRVDRIAFHLYVGCDAAATNHAQYLIDHVHEYESRFTQPLWLTEFACTDAASDEGEIAFMRDAVAFLESDARIERYAWFSGRFDGIPHVNLLGADGALTALGQAYVDAPANADCTH